MRHAVMLLVFLSGCSPTEMGVCEAADQKCDQNRVLTCSSVGTWEVTLVCPSDSECRVSDADSFGPSTLECAR